MKRIHILVKNEMIKIFGQKKYLIMLSVIFLLVILQILLTDHFDKTKNLDWQPIANNQIESYELQLNNMPAEMQESMGAEMKREIEKLQYALDNQNSTLYVSNFYSAVKSTYVFSNAVTIISIALICECIGNEFTQKTIKQLLIQKYKRSEILFSKVLTVIVIAMCLFLSIIVLSIVINAFLYQFDFGENSILYFNKQNQITEKSYYMYLFQSFIFNIIEVIVYILIGACFAVVSRSTSVSILFSILIYLGGTIVTSIYESKWEVIKYFILYNLDLQSFVLNEGNFWNVSLRV